MKMLLIRSFFSELGPIGDTGAPSASPTSAPIIPARNPKGTYSILYMLTLSHK